MSLTSYVMAGAVLLNGALAKAQDTVRPRLPCPDFSFKKMVNYKNQSLSLAELKGKVIILDFWNTDCIGCIEELPLLDSMQQIFGNEIQILPVANQTDDKVAKLFERMIALHKIHKGGLPSALDTVLVRKMHAADSVSGQHTWIDKNGLICYHSTGKSYMTVENIRAFINKGVVPALENANKEEQKKLQLSKSYDPNVPLFVNGNGGNGNDFIYRSILTHWYKQTTPYNVSQRWISARFFHGGVQLAGTQLAGIDGLYNIAYSDTTNPFPYWHPNHYGKYWTRPVLEMKDTSDFIFDFKDPTAKNLYCYSLVMPGPVDAEKIQEKMREDLNTCFGYRVTVETRIMPCWKITAAGNAYQKLKTSGTGSLSKGSPFHFELKNEPVSEIARWLWSENQNEPPFIDATGFPGNIDLSIESQLSDLAMVKKALALYGLYIVKSECPMKVIVIHDKD